MSGQLVLTGRAKDTIVLAGGENVEPQPLEDAICCSPIIQHAVVLGQDKRTLGCLVSLDAEGFASYLEVCHLSTCYGLPACCNLSVSIAEASSASSGWQACARRGNPRGPGHCARCCGIGTPRWSSNAGNCSMVSEVSL